MKGNAHDIHTKRWWRIPVWILCGVVAFIVAALTFLTFWLTPDRFSRITSEQLSERLEADFEIHNLRFTFWSTFPRFCLQADSIRVRSRCLDSLPATVRRTLPRDADRLAGCGRFKGGVNVANLLRGRLRLHDVVAEGLSLNLLDVNDSTSNYLIVPSDTHTTDRIPQFSANSVAIVHPRSITYRSLQSGLALDAALDSLYLKEHDGHRDTYDVTLSGDIGMQAAGLQILSGFPFHMHGLAMLAFDPLKVRFKDFGINLGNTEGQANLDVDTADGGGISDFNYTVESFRLMGLLKFLPPQYTPHISGLDHDLRLQLSARLVGPYHFSSATLPTVEVTARVQDGDLSYSFKPGDALSLRHEGLTARFVFDGACPDSSYVEIPRFALRGSGIDVDVDARVSDILAMPDVKAHVRAALDIAQAAKGFQSLASYALKGDLTTTADVEFHVPDPKNLTIRDFSMLAQAGGKGLHCRLADGTAIDTDTLTVKGSMDGSSQGIARSAADIRIGKTDLTKNGLRMSLKDLALKGSYDSLPPSPLSPVPLSPYASQPDARWLASLDHTPVFLDLKAGKGLAQFLNRRQTRIDLSTAGGRLTMKSYPDPFDFDGFTLHADADSLAITKMGFRTGKSSMHLAALTTGLRDYLTMPGTRTLPLKAFIDIDTLDFNSLAKACDVALREATGRSFSSPRPDSVTRSDMRAWMVPRNVDADIDLRADMVYWTNLDISDVSARIQADKGRLAIDSLRMKSTFCHADGALAYDTHDIQDIEVSADLGIEDIDFQGMLAKFGSMRRKWPELENLTGVLGVDGTASMHVYPDMAIEMASLKADLDLSGRELKLHQTHFIHHVCEMMAITTWDDLHIANIDVNVQAHDNLLELMPCRFEFPRYKLSAEGINDFAGHIDYHIGVLKSPIPFHFGINIEGDYHHPKLRFGGAGWDHGRGAVISSDIEKSFTLNLVKEVKSGMNEFMGKAATY